jgi:hypothetical protein
MSDYMNKIQILIVDDSPLLREAWLNLHEARIIVLTTDIGGH